MNNSQLLVELRQNPDTQSVERRLVDRFFYDYKVKGESFYSIVQGKTYSLNMKSGIYMFELEYTNRTVVLKVSFVVFQLNLG